VNVARFSPSGRLLGTGSDDCTLVLWRRAPDSGWAPLACEAPRGLFHDSGHPGGRSRHALRATARVATGHSGNMFGLAFLPENESLVATGAADGEVRLLDLEAGHESRLLRVWANAVGMVHDVAAVSPCALLSASSDGAVRVHDVREPAHQTSGGGAPGSVVVRWPEGRVNSLAASPLDPLLVAAAGAGSLVRLFDLRMSALPSPGSSRAALALAEGHALRSCVAAMRTPAPASGTAGVTGVRWSADGRRLVATASSGHVSVFDARDAWRRASLPHPGSRPRRAGRTVTADALTCWTLPTPPELPGGLPAGSPDKIGLSGWTLRWLEAQSQLLQDEAQAYGIGDEAALRPDGAAHSDSDSDTHEEGRAGTALQPRHGMAGRLAGMIARMWTRRRDPGTMSQADEMRALDVARRQALLAAGGLSEAPEHAPVFAPLRGARNSRTIKEAAFLGPGSTVVVAGSDCGHLFAWVLDERRKSGRLLRAWRADSRIVNVVEPMPSPALSPDLGGVAGLTAGWGLVTAGIDSSIRTWDVGGGSVDRSPPAPGLGCSRWLRADPAWAEEAAAVAEHARAGAVDEEDAMRAIHAAVKVFSDPGSFPDPDSPSGLHETPGETWPLFPLSSRPNRSLLGPAGPATIFTAAALAGETMASADEDEPLPAALGRALSPEQLRSLVRKNAAQMARASRQAGDPALRMELIRLMGLRWHHQRLMSGGQQG